jgi:hypothetical protein
LAAFGEVQSFEFTVSRPRPKRRYRARTPRRCRGGRCARYKESFFDGVKNAVFETFIKGLILMAENRFFSQGFIKRKNRVNPTVGFKFWN